MDIEMIRAAPKKSITDFEKVIIWFMQTRHIITYTTTRLTCSVSLD